MIRREIEKWLNATGKMVHQLELFEDINGFGKYRYSCFVTELQLPAKIVYHAYRGRSNSGNRIKDAKEDLSIDDFISNIFFSKGSLFKFHCYSLQFDVTLQTHLGNLRVKSRNFSKTYAMKCSQFRLLGVRGKEVYLASCTIPQDLRIFLEHTVS